MKRLPTDLVAQSVERRRSNPKVVGLIPTLVRVFLCPCVGPFPVVVIHVQYFYIMRFLVRHNRHHKVSQSVPLCKSRKTVTIFLRIKVGGHFVMSIVKCHESYYVGVLDNPRSSSISRANAHMVHMGYKSSTSHYTLFS